MLRVEFNAELAAFTHPHPLQRYWYVAGGIEGIPADRIVVLDGDYLIGPGLAVVRTPGHTHGNHSPAFVTDRGVWTVSENGISVDAYAPESSRIPGLRSHARNPRSVTPIMRQRRLRERLPR